MASRTVVIRMIADTKGFSGGVLGATRASEGLTKGLGKLNPAMAGIGTVAIAAGAALGIGAVAIGKSIGAWADFDAKMTESLAIMGDVSSFQRKDMADAAREVAMATQFSAEQAAESYFFLASAGLDAAASMEALPVVANFAQAGMFDMALATDLLTDAQSALGLTIRDDSIKNMQNMTRVGDVLVKANTLANASVQQFSEALTNKAGPAMRAVGMDIEEGVATLAVFADQGVKGADAGTKFSIVLRDLQTKAILNKGAFEEMNISVFDSEGEFRNMSEIIADVEGALEGMSDEAKKTTLLELGFSDKSVSALQSLIGTSGLLAQYEEGLRDAAGITDEVAGKQLDTFNAQMGLAADAISDAALSIGEAFVPLLEDLVPLLRDGADAAARFADTFGGVLVTGVKNAIPGLRVVEFLYNLIGPIVDENVRRNKAFSEVMDDVMERIEDGETGVHAYAEALQKMTLEGGITSDQLKDLNDEVDLTERQLANLAQTSLEYAQQHGRGTQATAALTQQLIVNARAMYENKEMTLAEIEAAYGSAVAYEVADIARRNASRGAATYTETLTDEQKAQIAAAEAAAENAITTDEVTKKLGEMRDAARDAAKAFRDDLMNSMSNFVSFFKEVPDEMELTLDEMEDNWENNFELQDRYWTGIAILAEEGMDDLVAELRKAGPEAARQVEALAADLDRAAEFEDMIESGKRSMFELSDGITNALGIEKQAWAAAFFEAGETMAIALRGALTGQSMLDTLREAGISLATAVQNGIIQVPLNAYVEIWGGDPTQRSSYKGSPYVGPKTPMGLRATGGPVMAGQSYIVGERGPEWFVPSTNGTVIPNGGGGVTVNVNNPTTRDLNRDLQIGLLQAQVAGQIGGSF